MEGSLSRNDFESSGKGMKSKRDLDLYILLGRRRPARIARQAPARIRSLKSRGEM